jgi:hypothetical protein
MTIETSVQRIARLTPLDTILARVQSRIAIQAFIAVLRDKATRARIRALGMEPAAEESI